jgi:hypothetical protein
LAGAAVVFAAGVLTGRIWTAHEPPSRGGTAGVARIDPARTLAAPPPLEPSSPPALELGEAHLDLAPAPEPPSPPSPTPVRAAAAALPVRSPPVVALSRSSAAVADDNPY